MTGQKTIFIIVPPSEGDLFLLPSPLPKCVIFSDPLSFTPLIINDDHLINIYTVQWHDKNA